VKISRLDDYQSWLISSNNQKILIDPWLSKRFSIPGMPWLLSRDRDDNFFYQNEEIINSDILLISSHYSDHLNVETLEILPKNIKVICSSSSYKVLYNLGFTDINILKKDKEISIGDISIKGVQPGFPYSFTSIGFYITDSINNKSILVETHVLSKKSISTFKNLNALIGTTESVKLFNINLSMSPQRTYQIIRTLKPSYFIPTGINVSQNNGLLTNFLNVEGNYNELEASLAKSDLKTQVVCKEVGSEITL